MRFIYKTTHISAFIYHKLQNMVPNQSLDNHVFLLFGWQIILLKKACMLIKTLQRKAKLAKKVCTYKFSIFSAANCHRVLNLSPTLC